MLRLLLFLLWKPSPRSLLPRSRELAFSYIRTKLISSEVAAPAPIVETPAVAENAAPATETKVEAKKGEVSPSSTFQHDVY